MTGQRIVVLDTDVFSALYIDPAGADRRGHPIERWRQALTGMRVVISFQTRAEVLAGVRIGNWGGTRAAAATTKVNAAHLIVADSEVVDSYAELTANCRRAGHALHAKVHTGDRWVAASAIAKDLPLMARDGIYRDAPGVRLFPMS